MLPISSYSHYAAGLLCYRNFLNRPSGGARVLEIWLQPEIIFLNVTLQMTKQQFFNTSLGT